MTVISVGFVDYRRYKPIKDGDVLWTIPAEQYSPEAFKQWYQSITTVHCHPTSGWPDRVAVGCGVEIGYKSGSSAPLECEICGSRDLRRWSGYGLMGLGEEPPADKLHYRFAPLQIAGGLRGSIETLLARRRCLQSLNASDLHIQVITAAISGLIAIRKTKQPRQLTTRREHDDENLKPSRHNQNPQPRTER